MGQPKVFVSHSHVDDAFAERLVADLRAAGADAWLDKTDLGAGNFQERISDALGGCEWFILVLTRSALASTWVRQEVDAANSLRHQGRIRDLIFIQTEPVEHQELPALWSVYNIFDAVTNYASARNFTLKAVGLPPLLIPPPSARIAPEHFPLQLARRGFVGQTSVVDGKPIEYIVPPVRDIPAGPFLKGVDLTYNKQIVTLPAFQIARYPVTVAEYACFVRAGRREPRNWQMQVSRMDHPVVWVSWIDAVAYAAWLSERTGQSWRLPTGEEWEKTARGADGRVFPWGDKFQKSLCNTSESGLRDTTPIGRYPDGAGPYGTEDQAGNIWEWTASLFGDSPDSQPVLRGGSWNYSALLARAVSFTVFPSWYVMFDIGCRLVVTARPVE